MPRKSKAFLRRSAAARKGWRTRRANTRKRSIAAKKGAATRKQNREQKRDDYVDVIGIDSLYE